MPVEDWIEKWTEGLVREIKTMSDNQHRIEDKHEARMDKIEKSIEDMRKENSEEFAKVYAKLDKTYSKLDEFIKNTEKSSGDRDTEQLLAIHEIRIKLAVMCGGVGIAAGAITSIAVSWATGFIGR
jgi:hypothetical protein